MGFVQKVGKLFGEAEVTVTYSAGNLVIDIPKECPEFWEEIKKLPQIYHFFDTVMMLGNETIVSPFRKGAFLYPGYTISAHLLDELSIVFTDLFNEIYYEEFSESVFADFIEEELRA